MKILPIMLERTIYVYVCICKIRELAVVVVVAVRKKDRGKGRGEGEYPIALYISLLYLPFLSFFLSFPLFSSLIGKKPATFCKK